MALFNKVREKKNLEEKVDWKVAMEDNNSNIDKLRNVATQVNIDPVMGEVVRENEESDKRVEDTFKKLAKELDGITPKDPDTGKKVTIKPYTEKLILDESLFDLTEEVEDDEEKEEEKYDECDESLEEKKACKKGSKHLCEDAYNAKEYTDMLFDMVENNMLDAKLVLKSLMYWVSEDDIHRFMKLNDLLWYEDDEDIEESLQEKFNKILKEAYSDGWDTNKLDELVSFLDELDRLSYEVRNCVKGAYSNCKTYSELGNYISNLGMQLSEVGDEVAEMEEDSEEEYDESLDVKKNKLNEYVAEDEVVEDEYTVYDFLNDRLFGYGLNKSNFRVKWKFAEVEPLIKTSKGKVKKSYFYPTGNVDDLVFGKNDDRRAFVENGIGVFVFDEEEASLAKECAKELNLDFDLKKLVRPFNGFNYIATIKIPESIEDMSLSDYVESIGKSMSDFLRKKGEKVKSDFKGHANYQSRKKDQENN